MQTKPSKNAVFFLFDHKKPQKLVCTWIVTYVVCSKTSTLRYNDASLSLSHTHSHTHTHTQTHEPSSALDVSPLSSVNPGQLREKFKTNRGSGVIYIVFTVNFNDF